MTWWQGLALLLIYPGIVLAIAVTGPHHPLERAEYDRRKAADRRKKEQL